MTKILIAAQAEAETVLTEVLSAHDLRFSHTIEQGLAECRSADPPDVIVCGLLFDDSRMFEFLRAVRADKELNKIQFVCCRILVGNLPAAAVEGLDIAARALGACAFVDIHRYVEACNHEQARALLEACFPVQHRR
jgi:hypothetical protein